MVIVLFRYSHALPLFYTVLIAGKANMVHQEIEHTGRLVIFKFSYQGRLVIWASGYLISEEGQTRLYLVSYWEARLMPPRRMGHVALARFARALKASHLVPVDHGIAAAHDRVSAGRLSGGFIPCLGAVTLEQLDAKLTRLLP